MKKKEFGPQPFLFPNPSVLVGTEVDGKPNFAAYAWCGIAGGEPPAVSVAIRHERYTLRGVLQNRTFSVNVPGETLMKEMDYCGIFTGAKTDKVKDCGFKVYYGKTAGAPLVEQCPVNLECEVWHLLDVGLHMLVVGKIVECHVSEDRLTDGQPDIMKIRPIIYSRGPSARYNTVGEVIGQAFQEGRKLKQ